MMDLLSLEIRQVVDHLERIDVRAEKPRGSVPLRLSDERQHRVRLAMALSRSPQYAPSRESKRGMYGPR